MNRRNFLKATAATLLGLLPWAKGRREPVAEGIIAVNGMGLDDLGPEAIAIFESIVHSYLEWPFLEEDESGVFPGIDQYVTTGYLDAESKPCPPLPDCPIEFEVTWGDCDDSA